MTTPAGMRDRYKRIVYRYRSIPGVHGLRVHTVSVVTATWSGAHVGDGVETKTTTEVVERGGLPPKVRWLSQEELTVGGLDRGTVEIGPITPDCSAGGTAFTTLLADSLTAGGTLQLLITGPQHPSGAVYEVTTSSGDHALHYSLQAKPVAQS